MLNLGYEPLRPAGIISACPPTVLSAVRHLLAATQRLAQVRLRARQRTHLPNRAGTKPGSSQRAAAKTDHGGQGVLVDRGQRYLSSE